MDKKAYREVLGALQQMQEDSKERRERKLWKEISLPKTYEKILEQLSKEELTLICRYYELRGSSTLRKKDLVDQLARFLPLQLKFELLRMDETRYQFLKQFISEDDKVMKILEAETYSNHLVEYWRQTGFVFSGSIKERKILFMPNEIHDAFRVLDYPSLQQNLERNTEIILLTQGMLFYYGVMGYQQILNCLEELTGSRPDFQEFHKILLRAKKFYNVLKMDDYGHWAHQDVEDIDYVLGEHRARPKVDFQRLSKSKLLKAGHPLYVDEGPAFRRLSGYLVEHYDMTEDVAKDLTRECQHIVNVELKPTALLDFLGTRINFPSFESVQELVNEVMEFSNHTRQWALKGHMSVELFAEEKTFLSPLPMDIPQTFNAPIGQPFTKTSASSKAQSNVIDFKTRQKIGRNDPCPCGSGKKYKHCCGRNQ